MNKDFVIAINNFGVFVCNSKWTDYEPELEAMETSYMGVPFIYINKHKLPKCCSFKLYKTALNNDELMQVVCNKLIEKWSCNIKNYKPNVIITDNTYITLHSFQETLMQILYEELQKDTNKVKNIIKEENKELYEDNLTGINIPYVGELDTADGCCLNASPKSETSASSTNPCLEENNKGKISVLMRRRVWDLFIGECVGKTMCPCCKMDYITQLTFKCGLIVSKENGGQKTLDNLHPMCKSCYYHMGKQDMHVFMQDYQFK